MVGVAQLVEPRIVDPVVVGSSPIVHPNAPVFRRDLAPTLTVSGPLAQLVEQLTLNQLVVGSSPTRPTIFQTRTLFSPLFFSSSAVANLGATRFLFRGVCCPVYSCPIAGPPRSIPLSF